MDPDEALELGQHAIEKVSRIAIFVGQKKQRIVCGRLGGELFILADYLQGLSDQVDHISKVLWNAILILEALGLVKVQRQC